MASAWYPRGIEAAFEGDIDVLVDTLNVVLVDTADYTFSAAHEDLADVPAGARVATGTLGSVTSVYNTGVWTLDAADTTLTSVTGDQSEAVIVYKDTGDAATSTLLLYLDLTSAVTPNGGNITLQYNASGLGTITT